MPADSLSGEGPLPGSWTAAFSLCPHTVDRENKRTGLSCLPIRTLISSWKPTLMTSSTPNYLSKSSPQKTIRFRGEGSNIEVWGTRIEPITDADRHFSKEDMQMVNKSTKRCSTSLEKCRSKPQGYHCILSSIARIKKSVKVSKMWKRWNPHALPVGISSSAATLENSLAGPETIKYSYHMTQQFHS